ncbi:MAG: carbohydrate binding domain-containing protein, partial [Candidatus Zipacnadales bacterium]
MRVAFVASLGLLGSVLLAQTGQPRSLITTNGGFEDGTEGWRADAAYELVIDPQMAYEGQKCLSGEVRAPNTHLTLAREFNLKAGALYTLSVWARGTNQTKIAVWRTSSTGHRENVAQWENQRPQWKRYEVSFAVETTGNWTLELIAPSSHGAPPGRVWLDNIQLSELDVPTPIDIAQGEGFNDWPRMVRSGDELFVTWISFRDGADQLMVAKTSLEGTLEWSVPVDFGERKGPYVLEPRLVPTGGGAWLLWAAELSGDWEIFAMKVISSGPQGCIRVTKHRGPDVKPVGVVYNGELFVAYETSLQGRRQVAIVRVTKGKPGRPQIISGPTGQHYEPCLAAPEKGPLTAAWSTFDNHNGDISIATFEGGRWSKPRRLTTAPTLDRHAVLYSAGADLWIAWENANSVAYHIGANNSRRIAIAKLRSDGLMSPVSLKTSPLWQWAEQATLAVDERGRLWVAYLVPRNRNVGWDVHLNCFSGTDCSASYRVSSMKGMDRPISLAFNRERLLAVFQADDLPNRGQTVEEALHSQA